MIFCVFDLGSVFFLKSLKLVVNSLDASVQRFLFLLLDFLFDISLLDLALGHLLLECIERVEYLLFLRYQAMQQ